jgi:hypothetical protein
LTLGYSYDFDKEGRATEVFVSGGPDCDDERLVETSAVLYKDGRAVTSSDGGTVLLYPRGILHLLVAHYLWGWKDPQEVDELVVSVRRFGGQGRPALTQVRIPLKPGFMERYREDRERWQREYYERRKEDSIKFGISSGRY